MTDENEIEYDELDMGEEGAVDMPSDIAALVDAIHAQDFNAAGKTFDELVADKLEDALEQEKVAVAGDVFNELELDGEEEVDADDEDETQLSDEDLQDTEFDDELNDLVNSEEDS